MEFDPNKTAAYLAGKIDEYVKQQARDTIMRNVEHDRFARYARIPDGKACDFCKMLGSRGFVYHSAANAGDREKGGESFHPFCNCQIAVSFDPAMRFYYKGVTKVSRGYDSGSPVDIDELFEQYVASGKSYTSGSRYRDYATGRKVSKLTAERFASYQDQLAAATSLDELHAVGDRIVAEWNPGRVVRDRKQWDQLSRYAKRLEGKMKVSANTAVDNRSDGVLPLSFNFLSRGDELRERIDRIKPKPGYQDYAIHSDGHSFTPLQGKSGRTVDVEELAIWIRSDKNFVGGPIRLLACSAGKYSDGAAQKLADILGVEVLAPEGNLYVSFDGSYTIARTKLEADLIMSGAIKQQLGWIPFNPKVKP